MPRTFTSRENFFRRPAKRGRRVAEKHLFASPLGDRRLAGQRSTAERVAMSAWTISGLMVARLAKEHMDPDSELPAGSTSARSDSDSEPAAEPSRRMYAEPKVTVMGGYEDATRPRKVDGETFEPLKSVIEPTPPTDSNGRDMFGRATSPTTILEKLGAMYEEMLARDSTTPLSQTGRTEGNF